MTDIFSERWQCKRALSWWDLLFLFYNDILFKTKHIYVTMSCRYFLFKALPPFYVLALLFRFIHKNSFLS